MALDLVLLGADGAPRESVAIEPDVHDRILAIARSVGLPLLLRLEDYYADAEFEPRELAGLKDEIERLAANATNDIELEALLLQVTKLIDLAIAEDKELLALAD